MNLAGRTLFITGGSRGIGLAIALRAARDGANIAIAAKTAEPHPKLDGTIHSAAEAIDAAGGRALPLMLDVRDAEAVESAVARAAEHFAAHYGSEAQRARVSMANQARRSRERAAGRQARRRGAGRHALWRGASELAVDRAGRRSTRATSRGSPHAR